VMTMYRRRMSRPIAVAAGCVFLLAVAIALHGGSQPSLNGSWYSNNPVQNGVNPLRTVTFSGSDTVVLGMLEGMVQGTNGDVQNTPPLHYTRPDASHIIVQDGPLALNYGYTLTNDTLTLSTGSITFTYHHA